MPALLAVAYINALVTTTRSRIRQRVSSDLGATTLELVMIVLGLIAVAGLLVAAITAAVKRRVDQIN
jgi:hypothetical protein